MPTNGSLLLDTNIVIGLLEKDPDVIQHLVSSAREILLPSIVIGELCYGARRSGQVQANLARVDDLARKSTVLRCDLRTAHQYGIVKESLRRKGRPIPENDIWIAATALQHGLPLVTRDTHFNYVNGLIVEVW